MRRPSKSETRRVRTSDLKEHNNETLFAGRRNWGPCANTESVIDSNSQEFATARMKPCRSPA